MKRLAVLFFSLSAHAGGVTCVYQEVQCNFSGHHYVCKTDNLPNRSYFYCSPTDVSRPAQEPSTGFACADCYSMPHPTPACVACGCPPRSAFCGAW